MHAKSFSYSRVAGSRAVKLPLNNHCKTAIFVVNYEGKFVQNASTQKLAPLCMVQELMSYTNFSFAKLHCTEKAF